MIQTLCVANFPKAFLLENFIQENQVFKGAFVLATCQRKVLVTLSKAADDPIFSGTGAQTYASEEAYEFLLEVICGLQSQMIAENEIVGQFKQALKNHIQNPSRESSIIILIEKLLKDSKEIRTKYLMQISQKTYSGLVRNIFQNNKKESPVLILGSGSLAVDLINQMKKKCEVYISARNEEKVAQLVSEHEIKSIPWKDYNSYKEFDHIANTIGARDVLLFDDSFFNNWLFSKESKNIFVDLGEPSTIRTKFSVQDGVYILTDVLDRGALKEQEKLQKIDKAREAIKAMVSNRIESFYKRKQSWTELQKNIKLAPEAASSPSPNQL